MRRSSNKEILGFTEIGDKEDGSASSNKGVRMDCSY
jgi:hypothetical protein